jgi:hypothetical protein
LGLGDPNRLIPPAFSSVACRSRRSTLVCLLGDTHRGLDARLNRPLERSRHHGITATNAHLNNLGHIPIARLYTFVPLADGEECFAINRLGIPPSLHRCLATTNLIESPQSGVRMRTRRVCRWRDTAMVARWAAASFLATEKNFRRIMGWKDLGNWKRSWEEKRWKLRRSGRRSRNMIPSAAPSTSNYARDTIPWPFTSANGATGRTIPGLDLAMEILLQRRSPAL